MMMNNNKIIYELNIYNIIKTILLILITFEIIILIIIIIISIFNILIVIICQKRKIIIIIIKININYISSLSSSSTSSILNFSSIFSLFLNVFFLCLTFIFTIIGACLPATTILFALLSALKFF